MANRSIATAGMISDTSLYNIDGACVASGDIPVGVAVSVTSAQPVDGHKVVAAGGNAPYGVVIKSHYDTPDGKAADKMAVNVMTRGRVWMVHDLDEAPDFGDAVQVNEAGQPAATGTATGWKYAGGFEGDFVEVQVLP